MRLEEIEKIEELYLLKNSQTPEIQIIEDYRKDVYWLSLLDNEKLEIRKKDLMKKHVFKELYSDSIILYEESVIELIKLIMKFLDDLSLVVFNKNMSDEEFLLFRLKNILYIELFAVNKRLNLKDCGHIAFERVIEPIFIEIECTTFYVQYKLQDLRDTYKSVSDLYKQDPYKKY